MPHNYGNEAGKMCCDKTMQVMNDFLDRTLSETEEQKVKSHLEDCEKCRDEFHSLENADSVLRQVVSGMVAGIDVPGHLSDRIEKTIAAESRKKTTVSRMFMLLKSPAAAAALIFVVLAAGFLSYNNYFNMISNQPKVVLSVPDAGNHTNGTGNSAEEKLDSIVGEDMAAIKEENVSQPVPVQDMEFEDIIKSTNATEILKNDQAESPAGLLSDKPLLPVIAQAPETLSKSQPVEEQRSDFITSVATVTGDGMPAQDRGTMEEAIRAVGYIPAKPSYLPQGAVLSDVSWHAGETSQNYRVGEFYFTVTQSRLDAANFGYDETRSQGSAVDINGSQGYMRQSRPEPVDSISAVITTLNWQEGNWSFSVSGGLPAEEIIRIAASVK
jgi:hypothetical protein